MGSSIRARRWRRSYACEILLPRQNSRTAALTLLGLLEIADVTAVGDHDETGTRDRPLEVVRDGKRRARVELAPDEQGRDGDGGEDVVQVRLGHE